MKKLLFLALAGAITLGASAQLKIEKGGHAVFGKNTGTMKTMEHVRVFMSLLLIFLGGGMMKGNSPILVEEGRTWWYFYWYWDDQAMNAEWEREDFGLSFGDSEEIDGVEWQKCMVVSKTGSIVLDFPIALLRQEGSKVYVMPHHTTPSEWENVMNLPARFGEVYGRFLCFGIGEADDPNEEYLLYNWEMKTGDTLFYPWIMDYPSIDKIVTITSSKTEGGTSIWYGIWGWDDRIQIVEGVGGVATSDYRCGTFVYPCSYRQVTTGMMGDPDILFLEKVTDKSGEVIWSPTSGVESIGADAATTADEAIYDLHGRRVVNPQPGSIYIRGGRKFVGR